MQAPIADTIPIANVTHIRLGVAQLRPMYISWNSSSSAGSENTAMNTSGAIRL